MFFSGIYELADNGGQHRGKQRNEEKNDELIITIKRKKQ